MYKYLLCWRYLRTRFIALASIISVTLGVATMIVVNSVMEGFTGEMQNRIHEILGDLVVESRTIDGMPDFDFQAQRIQAAVGDDVVAMSPVVAVPAVLYFEHNGRRFTRQIDLLGIDEKTQAGVSGFGKYLQHADNRKQMSFDLRPGDYDTRDHQGDGTSPEREQMKIAGQQRRRENAQYRACQESYDKPAARAKAPGGKQQDLTLKKSGPSAAPFADPFGSAASGTADAQPDPNRPFTGAVLGIAMAGYRDRKGVDRFLTIPGDDVKIAFFTVAQPPKIESDNFTVVDFYESKMSEYDSRYVFVPIRKLQELRGMIDPTSGVGLINAVQVKLRPGANGDAVRDRLRAALPEELYGVYTWRDKQGALLDAVDLETRLLNVLLFLIIAVAGFGILAIFFMIVVEKTRDIGILKSLGASRRGVMGIFLGYGLLLGLVGAGVGTVLGLVFVWNINSIANGLAYLTGKPVFDPSIYYFYKIPAIVMPWTVTWIVVGAIVIAVAASILPANRAARLHPVEALRYE
jgi:lipoprotein-releasing system permease protein